MMLKVALFFLIAALLPSCYLTKQGYYLVRHQTQAVKVDDELRNPKISDRERQLFLKVRQIREFGIQKLGLADTGNYTSYVRIKKNYLMDIVSASAKDKFEDYVWSFPFFGEFPYKGFYERRDAENLAKDLKEKNLDVLIRKTDAYSTLGYFSDPLYSYMADYSTYELAALILHEMTHSTVYVTSQMQFNENLASFVEREGALMYLREVFGEESKEYNEAIQKNQDSESFLNQMKKLAQSLNQVYQGNLSFEEKLKEREKVFEAFKKDYSENYDKNFKSKSYRFVENLRINNAYIRLFLLYEEKLGLFYQYYETQNQDLIQMLDSLKFLEKNNENPFLWMREKIKSWESAKGGVLKNDGERGE